MSDHDPLGPLYRASHRRRTRPRGSVLVLNRGELADALDCELEDVESELRTRGIAYHVDAAGDLWASLRLK